MLLQCIFDILFRVYAEHLYKAVFITGDFLFSFLFYYLLCEWNEIKCRSSEQQERCFKGISRIWQIPWLNFKDNLKYTHWTLLWEITTGNCYLGVECFGLSNEKFPQINLLCACFPNSSTSRGGSTMTGTKLLRI